MYHYNLSIGFIGFTSKEQDILQSMPPLERFEQKFFALDDISAAEQREIDVFLVDEDAWREGFPLPQKNKGKWNILCTAHPDRLTPEEIKQWSAVWSRPFSHALLQFYFGQLQAEIKREKDAWLCQNYFDTLMAAQPDMVWFKDLRGAHLKVNPAFCRVVGKEMADVEGRGHYYIWGLTKEQYEKGEYVCVETDQEVIDAKKMRAFDEHVKAGDKMMELKTYKTPIFAEDGSVMGTIGVARDVTQERAYYRRMLQYANTDYLTGLVNRRYFHRYLEENRGDQQLTLIYFDLDEFKEINDRYGHQAGDQALIIVSGLLKEIFPKGLAARIGGDEFLVAYLGPWSIDDCCQRLEKMLIQLQRDFSYTCRFRALSISAGVASTKNPAVNIDRLLSCSDEALYEAKRRGKAQYAVFKGPIEP